MDLKDPDYLVPMYIGPRNSLFSYYVNKEERRAMCYVRGDWPADLTKHVKNQIDTVSGMDVFFSM